MISALYQRLKLEAWPVGSDYFADEKVIAAFPYRPEIFLEHHTLGYVNGLSPSSVPVLSNGRPNSNHRAIARFLHSGYFSENVTTTEF